MIEPTETESKETLDAFIKAMKKIAVLAETKPEVFHDSPQMPVVSRPDEISAARNPKLKWTPTNSELT
jgi:glycine dehydrogenase subunit 2